MSTLKYSDAYRALVLGWGDIGAIGMYFERIWSIWGIYFEYVGTGLGTDLYFTSCFCMLGLELVRHFKSPN